MSLLIRSKLFVPGARPELFDKAMASAADSVSFDLEDSVTRERKTQAREDVAAYLRKRPSHDGKIVVVRVNALSSEEFPADLEALAGSGVDVINVPKMGSGTEVCQALDAFTRAGMNRTPLLATIETPKGVRLAAEIAAADRRVAGLQLGFKDLFSIAGITTGEQGALYAIRLSVRLAAAESGVPVFDSAFTEVKNIEGFRGEAETARRLGLSGKSCIHPSQIAIANEVFSPRAAEIAEAEKIVAAATEAQERGVGVLVLDGQMIDKPVLDQARAVLRLAQSIKTHAGTGN